MNAPRPASQPASLPGAAVPPAPAAEPGAGARGFAPFRVGSVSYLNAVPLTWGWERDVLFRPPSTLAELLRRDALDAAMVSVTEVLFHDRYDVLEGIAIAAREAVVSVILAHRVPLAELQECFCDTASLTSVNLLRVLLAEQGCHPVFKPLPAYERAGAVDAVLLIGDRAIDFSRSTATHRIWDLGAAWRQHTGLPFVFAVWALRRGLDNAPLRRQLHEAKAAGVRGLPEIIARYPAYDTAFRRAYFTENIHYELGPEERRGLARFIELLRRHTPAPVYSPRFV